MPGPAPRVDAAHPVPMKSGLEGRNNELHGRQGGAPSNVSMKSGLEGRNNNRESENNPTAYRGLNEVRPRRPEQWVRGLGEGVLQDCVSMKSGLEGRNNEPSSPTGGPTRKGLNEVRPKRPEQFIHVYP